MDKMIFLPEFSGLVFPATPSEQLAIDLLDAGIKMRRAQNCFFDLRRRHRLPFTDSIVKEALQDAILTETVFDELLESVRKKTETHQYQMFDE